MAIETTYQSLLGAQRQRRKKQERQDTLLQAGTLAANLYQQNLDKKAQEFFDRTEVADQRVKYQEGYDLFNNKIKKVYDQGTNSVGGLGNYLVDNYAMGIAQDRIYSNYDEDMVQDPDELGSAVRSYAEEMVYGTRDAEGNRVGGAMLDRLTAAYNSGKTLQSMDKYDEYISRRADLPENVGMALVGKFFDKKSREEVEQDALRRIGEENQFTQDSTAFMTLAQAFDQGMTITDSEKVAKQVKTYTDGLKRRPEEVLTNTEEVTRKRPDGQGGQFEWHYFVDTFTNQKTGVTRQVSRADPNDELSAKIYAKEEVTLPMKPVEFEQFDSLSGEVRKGSHIPLFNVSGEKIGSFDEQVVSREVSPQLRNNYASVGERQLNVAETSLNYVLRQDPESLRDSFDKAIQIEYGEDEDQADVYRENVHRNIAIIGNNLQAEYGIKDQVTANNIAAQIIANNIRYIKDVEGEENKGYSGANLAASNEISGLRILEALNDLELNTGGKFQMKGFSKPEFDSFLENLIQESDLQYFRGASRKDTTRETAVFDESSRLYFLKRNLPKDNSRINLFNRRLPYVTDSILAGVTLYDMIEYETMSNMTRGLNTSKYYENKELTEDEALAKIQATISRGGG
jgi:hypothetical protein